MELLFALLIVPLVAAGLALGLMLRGRALQSSCGGMSCLPGDARCAGCPNRAERGTE